MKMHRYLMLAFLFIFTHSSAHAEPQYIQGENVRVVDGDTLEINQYKIRVQGIDAPETAQICGQAGKSVYCGKLATYELENLIGNQEVKCLNLGNDKYGRIIGECYLGELDINQWMVKNGWALAYRKYSTKYVQDEEYAKQKGLGIWGMEFIEPWNWRSVKKSMSR
ncbi:MAG: thermonuclease family protein [Alphaproteobacteria bacterium]